MDELHQFPAVLLAAGTFTDRLQSMIDLCIQIQQIPAPTGAERARADWVAQTFQRLGVADVLIDECTNVYGRIPGQSKSLQLLVSAHTDTVFPIETDLTTHFDPAADRLWGPGIGDNSLGVAALVLLAETLRQLPPPPVDIWLVANTGEEGLGDLRGMRAVVDRLQPRLGACVVIEGMGLRRVVHRALGSHRYRITIKAPGGHSWSDFGAASAVHVLVRLAAEITLLQPPALPRTTFNIGRIHGGTSINTIAQQAALELDLRSEDRIALTTLTSQVMEIIGRYQGAEWQQQGVRVEIETIGNRPSGAIGDAHPLVLAAYRSLASCGVVGHAELRISSTDANIPLSRGIPALCLGITDGGNAHRLEEWISPSLLPVGMKHLLYTTWWAAVWLGGGVNRSDGKANRQYSQSLYAA